MEQVIMKKEQENAQAPKKRMGRPRKNDVAALVEQGLVVPTCRGKRGPIPAEERTSNEWQLKQMRLINADLLLSFRKNLKLLDLRDQMALFKAISPFIGYSSETQKNSEDIGMDAFAERYVEIEAKIKSISRISSSK